MTSYTMRLAARSANTREDPSTTFYWPMTGPSSFLAPFGPRLGSLGPVSQPNIDLVRLALLVFAADRSTPRAIGNTSWSSRSFEITAPVADEKMWTPVADDLGDLLGFLTGDTWTIGFRTTRAPKETIAKRQLPAAPTRVVLMSGGADSALGVLESRRRLGSGEGHILVSHVGPTMIAPIQRNVAEAAERLVPGPWQEHRAIRLVRGRKQVDGSRFKSEPSTRSRSLLFLSLGLAVASVHDVPLWIPENGFASLNPPLAPNRRGSLSTRTTHPAFLVGLSTILERVGAQHEIVNPFVEQTKGEMFANAARALGTRKIGAFLSDTHSCGLTGQRAFGASVSTHCGVCFGCVVRRSSFASAGLIDGTEYLSDTATGDLERWLSEKSVLPDMRGFTRRGVSNADIASMSLPLAYPTATARGLCERAINELRNLVT